MKLFVAGVIITLIFLQTFGYLFVKGENAKFWYEGSMEWSSYANNCLPSMADKFPSANIAELSSKCKCEVFEIACDPR